MLLWRSFWCGVPRSHLSILQWRVNFEKHFQRLNLCGHRRVSCHLIIPDTLAQWLTPLRVINSQCAFRSQSCILWRLWVQLIKEDSIGGHQRREREGKTPCLSEAAVGEGKGTKCHRISADKVPLVGIRKIHTTPS